MNTKNRIASIPTSYSDKWKGHHLLRRQAVPRTGAISPGLHQDA